MVMRAKVETATKKTDIMVIAMADPDMAGTRMAQEVMEMIHMEREVTASGETAMATILMEKVVTVANLTANAAMEVLHTEVHLMMAVTVATPMAEADMAVTEVAMEEIVMEKVMVAIAMAGRLDIAVVMAIAINIKSI